MKTSSYIFNLFLSTKIATKNLDEQIRSIPADIYKDLNSIVGGLYGEKDIKTREDLINSFDNHQSTIDTFNYSSTPELSNSYLRLLSEYALSLSVLDKDKKAIPFLDKALLLYERNYSKELFQTETYEFLLWHRGKCNFNLKHFDIAKADFDVLVKHYPDNAIYQKWVDEFANIKLSRLINVFYFLLFISLICSFFKNNLLLHNVSFYLLFVFGGIIIVTESILYKRRHKSAT